MTCTDLSDEELTDRLDRLVAREGRCCLDVLEHLAEFDSRDLAEKEGSPSLYVYCTSRLGFTEAEAYKRIQVARTIRRFPLVLQKLRSRDLPMTAVLILAPYLTHENHAGLLTQAAGKSTRDLQMMVATLAPRPDAKDCMRRLPAACLSCVDVSQRLEPLSEDRVMFRFTGSQELRSKFEKARQLLRRKYPHGAMEEVISEALDALLYRLDPAQRHQRRLKRHARRPREPQPAPCPPPEPSTSHTPSPDGGPQPVLPGRPPDRRIPQAVRDEVWVRDGGQCAYLTPDGRRCTGREWLDYDHIIPWALGGRSDDPSNIRLLCPAHNQLLAREVFGVTLVEQRAAQRANGHGREPPNA